MLGVRQYWHITCVAPIIRQFVTSLPQPALAPHQTLAVGSQPLIGTSLQVLQQRNRQLRATLAAIPWPPLVSFRLREKTYTLPLTSSGQMRDGMDAPSLQKLEYLAGFFDGDGSVSNRCSLHVGQSVDGVAVLLLMQGAFGGSIIRCTNGKGLQKPTLVWQRFGNSARCTAGLLAPHSIVKRRQLELTAEGLPVPADKGDWSLKLDVLKRSDSSVVGACTWAYVAGFFDADGHIKQQKAMASLVLVFTQKHPTVLVCLQNFLARQLGVKSHISCVQNRWHQLTITKTSSCKAVLQKMMASGLLRKAAQAHLAVKLTKQNAAQVRDAMAAMVGNQGFLRRFDSAGCQRASAISAAQLRAKKAAEKGDTSLAESLHADVERQKHEHALLNAVTMNKQLLTYISKIRGMYHEPIAYKL
ncbi:unnamed protein product [Symbiodinium sp. CCMP2456]|nr:unnamed protein product [Symbiodinium sp. CCMP2456]